MARADLCWCRIAFAIPPAISAVPIYYLYTTVRLVVRLPALPSVTAASDAPPPSPPLPPFTPPPTPPHTHAMSATNCTGSSGQLHNTNASQCVIVSHCGKTFIPPRHKAATQHGKSTDHTPETRPAGTPKLQWCRQHACTCLLVRGLMHATAATGSCIKPGNCHNGTISTRRITVLAGPRCSPAVAVNVIQCIFGMHAVRIAHCKHSHPQEH